MARDGVPYGAWKALAPDTIEIETEIGDHAFAIHTGYRPGATAVSRETPPGASAPVPSPVARRTRLRPLELATARAALAGGGGCPCCAGPSAP